MNYILKDKIPIPEPDLILWAKWYEKAENRRVAHDVIENGLEVSTIFLGIDHQFNQGSHKPMLFETMIRRGETEVNGDLMPYYDEQWRYSTWEQAETGHNRIVKALMDGLDLPPEDENSLNWIIKNLRRD